MAATTSWHRYGTKLRHCHPMLSQLSCWAHIVSVDTADGTSLCGVWSKQRLCRYLRQPTCNRLVTSNTQLLLSFSEHLRCCCCCCCWVSSIWCAQVSCQRTSDDRWRQMPPPVCRLTDIAEATNYCLITRACLPIRRLVIDTSVNYAAREKTLA